MRRPGFMGGSKNGIGIQHWMLEKKGSRGRGSKGSSEGQKNKGLFGFVRLFGLLEFVGFIEFIGLKGEGSRTKNR